MLKLFKIERYEFDFVLAANAKQAEDFEFGDSDPTTTVTEVTEMSPSTPGITWNPYNTLTGTWIDQNCGEWLRETEETRLQEKELETVLGDAFAKLTETEKAAVLNWALKQPKV